MKSLIFSLISMLFISSPLFAQENVTYQKPPKEILELVDIERAPTVQLDSKGDYMVLLYRDSYPRIEELSEPEIRLGGLRINPVLNINSRTTYFNNVKVKKITDKAEFQVKGLPENPRLSNFRWSPDETKLAFTHTTQTGVELWVMDIKNARVTRLSDPFLNANLGNPIQWFRDSNNLLIKTIPSDRKPLIDETTAIPTGPTVSIASGSKAQNRTYQDLLKNPNDEFNFEQLTLAELKKVSLTGKISNWAESAMIWDVSFSPDGNYIMVTKIEKPFSYLVPYSRFPQVTTIHAQSGKLITTVNEVPLTEELPKGFMSVRTGKRNMGWRQDQPSTLYWMEALDDGDPEKETAHRDQLFTLEAPFEGQPQPLFKSINRMSSIIWGSDDMAVAYDYWWNTRNTKSYLFNPSAPSQQPVILEDRNYQDLYNDPGSMVTIKNEFNRNVLYFDNNSVYMIGDGYSPTGQFPFIDKLNLKSMKKERIYQSNFTDKKENILYPVDVKKGRFLVRIESPTDYPNFYIRDLSSNELEPITAFINPFKSIQSVHKEVIRYKRDDGLDLSATLYLPVGYDQSKKEKMPMLLWAYPTEFKDKASAGQTTANPNEFTYPSYGSLIYWVTRGYVVLDDASFPIVGEGDEEPNDSFIKQLVANARAAIDAVDNLGFIDRNRVGVAGHSYGAFMTANLLSHSDLFAAGIARSGAYNRTLTPFGFQAEERNYWEAPEIYYAMSPFMHADKMKTPLLLIHGEADNNSGTYPLQSERYFNALKGLGAPARLVLLPKESHGYQAMESILHVLWEQDQWLEQYVKNRSIQSEK